MRKDALESLITQYEKKKKWTIKSKNPRILWLRKFMSEGEINMDDKTKQLVSSLEKSTDISLSDFKTFLEKNGQIKMANAITDDIIQNEKKYSSGLFRQFISSQNRMGLNQSHFANTPSEIKTRIANYLGPEDITHLTQTSSIFYQEAKTIAYWKDKLIAAGCDKALLNKLSLIGVVKNYKNLYRAFISLKSSSRKNLHALWQLLCLSGEPQALDYAIKKEGLTIENQKNNDFNALHFTVLSGNPIAMDFMIKKVGFDIHKCTHSGLSVLHLAALSGNPDAMHYAVKNGINPLIISKNSKNALHYAAKSGSKKTMHFAIKKLGISLNNITDDKRTALHFAAASGKVATILYAIKKLHMDPMTPSNEGLNALHYAVKSDNLQAVKTLIELGIKTNSSTPYHANALHFSMASRNPEIWQFVKNTFGLDPASTTTDGYNALHYAVMCKNPTAIMFAINELGIHPTDKVKNQNDILIIAFKTNDIKTIEQVAEIYRHANIDPKRSITQYGENPLHIATLNGNVAAMRYAIMQLGINPKDQTLTGETALHLATRENHVEAVQFLASLHNDPKFKDKIDPYQINHKNQNTFWYVDHFMNKSMTKPIITMLSNIADGENESLQKNTFSK